MNILQLCNKLPYPEKDGGAIAIASLSNSLLEAGCKVKMLAMNTSRHYVNVDLISKEFRDKTSLEAVDVNTDIRASAALWALLTGKSYNIWRFISNGFKEKLAAILKEDKYDIVQLEGLYLTPYIHYIRSHSKAKIVLRAHNVEWIIWEKLAGEASGIKKLYLNSLAKSLKAYEARAINKCDAVTVFTQVDKKQLIEMGCKVPVEVFPFGIDLSKYQPAASNHISSLFFIGALDWMPNLQGLEWFLNKVWSKVHASFPKVEFNVAGRNMPTRLLNASHPNVRFHGEVENALNFMNGQGIMVSPLFAGSGIRVKIIEGMALGKAIVATSLAAQGIECKPGKDILIANSPEESYEAIKHCLESSEFIANISGSARAFVESSYNIKTITTNLLRFYTELINA